MRTIQRHGAFVIAIAAAGIGGAFLGCSDFTPPGATTTSALAVNPRTAHVNVGGSMQLNATGASGVVAWSSSDETIATVSSGKVTGVGSGTATIRAVSGANQATSRVAVTRAAAIALSNPNLTFSGIPSSAIPDSQTVDVTDGGEDPLSGLTVDSISYGVGAAAWLTARLSATDAPAKLVVRPNTSALNPGSYTATVFISSPLVTTGPQVVAVRFTLVRPAAIAMGSSGVTFTVQQNAALPGQQTIDITDGGDAPLTGLSVGTIAYSAGATGWLEASVTPSVAPASLLLRPNSTALTPGNYSATVPVTSPVTGIAPAQVTVTYHVTAAPTPPTIVLSRSSLPFSATIGDAIPAQATLDVTNGGQLPLTGLTVTTAYAAGQPANWLTITPGGTAAPTTITVQPNTTGLAAGAYSATVTVASVIAANQSVAFNVTYTLNRPAAIVLGSTRATFGAEQGTANPGQQSIGITNGGDVPLTGLAVGTITFSSGASGWLNASVTSSTLPSSLLLQPNKTSLPIGDYTATVAVTSSVAPAVSVTVTYHVTAAPTPPSIVLSTTSLTFSGTSGDAILPTQKTIDVSNGGQVSLTGVTVTPTYTNGQPPDWLTVTPTGTTAPLTVTVQPNETSLAAGTYTATITVASSAATNSPQTVSVTYTLIRPASIALDATSKTFDAQQGGAIPSQQQIAVTNGGDAPLTGLSVGTITYSAGATGWLVASLSQSNAPSTLLLQPNAVPAAGDYTASFAVTSSVAGVPPVTVTVTYHVALPPPVIVLNPTALTFTAGRNFGTLPGNQTVSITSTGGTTSGLSASVTYVGTTGWLNTSFAGGVTTSPTTLNVQPNKTTLTAGVYSATIHVSSTTTGVVTRDIPVTYVVNDLVLDQTSVSFLTTTRTPPTAKIVNVSNAGSGNISGVTATVALLTGRPANLNWLQATIASTVPQSPSATSLTLTVLRADSLGDFTAQVTVSAPNMVSKAVSISYRRQATMASDVLPILQTCAAGCHNSATPGNFNTSFADATAAYNSLLTPNQNPGHTYVVLGDSVSSNLYKVLNGSPPAGYFAMPSSSCTASNQSTCLNSQLRTRIYIWIMQGALKQ